MPSSASKEKAEAKTAAAPPKLTPAMQQFARFKKQYPDCVLFFRMGDFYEMFYDDARLAHRVLGVTLTQRSEGVPMAGVPYHAVENYLRRMIEAGHRVAICDQVEDPKQAKGVVKRDVTRLITPGTLTDETMLDEGQSHALAAVMVHYQGQGPGAEGRGGEGEDRGEQCEVSVAWAELSTGAFHLATFDAADLGDELARINPSELLYVETANREAPPRIKSMTDSLNCATVARPGWQFRADEARQTLCTQFQVKTLSGFGLEDDDLALGPAAAIVAYLLETQRALQTTGGGGRIAHLRPPKRFGRSEHLVVDQTSLRALEIERTMRGNETAGSLLAILQDCRTAMGKRQLRQWLCYPLGERGPIVERQRAVGAMVEDSRFLAELRSALDEVQDVQRIMGRVAVGRALPRDVTALGRSALAARQLCALLDSRPSVASLHDALKGVVESIESLGRRIDEACVDSPPAHLREGGLIADGYDKQLDECRSLQRDSNAWLAGYQKELTEQTGIANLKVGYNKVFGYYIEVTAAHRQKIDDDPQSFAAWTRKQTLKNAERYITPPLKEYEAKVLTAKERAIAREQTLFAELCDEAAKRLDALHTLGDVVASLDVLACFARRAARFNYARPRIVDEPALHIEGGRHPVLDELLGDQFVPNDLTLGNLSEHVTPASDLGFSEHEASASDSADSETPQSGGASLSSATLALITGPNMAGKSTYIRQAALITLLAHTGSFVPATRATVGLCDRIFTRIGASDELHTGQSTFMVEMTETANICHHATERSLVILDEIGRGTSTLDGLSLAWAIAEFIAQKKCRALFATHYHELTQLPERFDNVCNLNVIVREWQDEIVFLHRILPGAADRSYGIHVAKIAGLPPAVVSRADELLGQLEVSHESNIPTAPVSESSDAPPAAPANSQLSLFTEYIEHPAMKKLREADLDNLTPMQAFDLLRALRAEAEE